eukprot:TRINITY_DN7474_c0_g2_i1.p3 TRINITY_DN7474_c0_g2~~TRINITY_DN7474_c0_g2_i1.p3  ORF type:complete len:141 (+),score=12.93 TRINITY_DN7474_c0_g2_i1:1055-1477(+)
MDPVCHAKVKAHVHDATTLASNIEPFSDANYTNPHKDPKNYNIWPEERAKHVEHVFDGGKLAMLICTAEVVLLALRKEGYRVVDFFSGIGRALLALLENGVNVEQDINCEANPEARLQQENLFAYTLMHYPNQVTPATFS